MSFCIDQFWPKVGELLYKKGADVGLRPDGLVVKSAAEKIEAERILSQNIPSEHSHKRKVINPSLGELVAAMGQIDEFRNVRAQFMTQRLAEGATMQQAEKESKEITEENVQKAKELRAERAKRKTQVLDKIESRLPKSSNPEVRARLIQAYLNEHGREIIAESEQYTLGEIKAEVDLKGSVKSEKAKSFLAKYAEADETLEGYEGDLKTAAKEFGQLATKAAYNLDRMLIPGYSAWADGGTTTEVIASAGSDVALTLVGGKLIKVAWTGSKALYREAKALGKAFTAKGATFEIAANKVPYNPRATEQLASKLYGTNEFSRSTLPDLSQPNVKMAGLSKEREIVINPETKETITQRVVFDQRGYPIFDPYVKVETRISGDLSNLLPDTHMRMATRQLRADVESGKISKSIFSSEELMDIAKGSKKIGGYTWHHHQETGRMQLVPTDIHEWIKHVGGNKLWGMKK